MGKEEFLKDLSVVRRDLGDLLFHFTRRVVEPVGEDPFSGKYVQTKSAMDVLKEVLAPGKLKGGTGYIKGGSKCVCFTESPITELASLFRLLDRHDDRRYEPYGVAVKKGWLFAKGGRPVIYQPESFGNFLHDEQRYLHNKYEPPGVDFRWEREWRIKTESLELDHEQTFVVVPSAREALELSKTGWMAVSLDLFA